MLDNLNQIQGTLYSRAVEPAVESRLRSRNIPELTPSNTNTVQDRQSRVQQEHQQQSQHGQMTRGEVHNEQRAKDVAEQLSQAVRQAKQTPAKYRPSFSLTSTTGRRANQSYLTIGQPKEFRVVDELA